MQTALARGCYPQVKTREGFSCTPCFPRKMVPNASWAYKPPDALMCVGLGLLVGRRQRTVAKKRALELDANFKSQFCHSLAV